METQIQKERQGEGEGKRETREENTKACSSISLLLANACVLERGGGEQNEAVFGQKRGREEYKAERGESVEEEESCSYLLFGYCM